MVKYPQQNQYIKKAIHVAQLSNNIKIEDQEVDISNVLFRYNYAQNADADMKQN